MPGVIPYHNTSTERLDFGSIKYRIMRVQFGQHTPVDRRRWRHEIDFVILRPEGPKNLVEMRSFAVASHGSG